MLATWGGWHALTGGVRPCGTNEWAVSLEPNGMVVLSVDLTLADDPQGPDLRSFTIGGPYLAPVATWSFFTTADTWVQWRVQGTDGWTDATHLQGYALSATLDLSTVDTPAVVEVRIATAQPDGGIGYSPVTEWNVPKLVVATGPNLALGRPVDVTSTYTSAYTGDKAVDGNKTDLASRWLSATDDVQPAITVHLGAVTTPKLVRTYSGPNASHVVVSFTVQALTAGGGWTRVGSVSGNTESMTDVPLDAVTTEQVRLVITGRSRDPIDVVRIFEVEIYLSGKLAGIWEAFEAGEEFRPHLTYR